MATHISVRMAWHDNKWNGHICKDPQNNFYCTGTHSLLSARIARDKDMEVENDFKEDRTYASVMRIDGALSCCLR